MAELSIRVNAEYQSAIECRKELDEVVKKLHELNENSSPKEIEELTKQYVALTAKYDNSISFISKSFTYMKDIVAGVSREIKYSSDVTKDLGDSSADIVSNAQKRLELERNIQETLRRQRDEVASKKNESAINANDAIDRLASRKDEMSVKYNGADEGFYSEQDRQELNDLRSEIDSYKNEWNELNNQVMVFDQLIEDSDGRTKKLIDTLRNTDTGFDAMVQDLKDTEALVAKLTEDLKKYRADLEIMKKSNDPSSADDIEKQQEKIEETEKNLSSATERIEMLKGVVTETKSVFTGFLEVAEDTSRKIFITEDAYNSYEKLHKKIYDLQNEINNMSSGEFVDADKLKSLQDELTKSEEEYEALGNTARNAAEVLGDRMAEKVEKALNNLYELNRNVRALQVSYDDLTQRLKDAKEEMAAAKTPEDIKNAAEKVNDINNKLSEVTEKLSKSKALQKDAVEDVEKLSKGFGKADDNVKKMNRDVDDTSDKVKGMVKQIAAIAGLSVGMYEIKNIFDQAMHWREYFQDIESSMKVFLGSAEKGAEFTEELKKYAYRNMFEFSDLAAASQQMISYGHNVEDIIPRLDQLSNVATGTHGNIMELVDSYNRAKATGVVDARGVQSWAVKGVMIKDTLREIGETVSGTTVTFEQLNKVLDHVTGEGGRFHNLMLEMMDNISAERGQLEDNLSLMYEEMGAKFEGAYIKFLKLQQAMADGRNSIVSDEFLDWGAEKATNALSYLIDNWKDLVSVIKTAAVAYGSYRAVSMAEEVFVKIRHKWFVAERLARKLNNAEVTKEALAKAAESGAEAVNTAAKNANTASTDRNTASTVTNTVVVEGETVAKKKNTAATVLMGKALNGLGLTNPYFIIAAGVASLAVLIYKSYEGMMTQAKAQKLLNSAAEDYTDTIKEQTEKDASNIAIIQDKTKSLMAQTKAYRELIAESKTWAQYSMNEIKNMTPEQVSQKNEEEERRKEEEGYRKRLEVLQELRKEYGNASDAWLYAEDATIDRIVKEKGLDEDYATKLKDSINGQTNLRNWTKEMLEQGEKELQEYLATQAENGVVEGFKKGFTNNDVKLSAENLMKGYSESISKDVTPIEQKIEEYQQKISDIRSNRKANGGLLSPDDVRTITDYNKKIEELTKKAKDAKQNVFDQFSGKFNKELEASNERLRELDKKLEDATGYKKTSLLVEWKQAVDERDTWAGLAKLVEAGKVDTEVVVKVNRQIENQQLGDEKLVEIGKDYEMIDDIGQDVATRIEDTKKRYKELQKTYKEQGKEFNITFEQMLEDAGVTAEGIDADFKTASDHIGKDIIKLKKDFKDTKDDVEKNKIKLEIDRKKEQLDYIYKIKTRLKEVAKDPFNLKLKISAIIPGWLKKKLKDWFDLDIDKEEKEERSVSDIAKDEKEEAQTRIDEANKKGSEKHTDKEWQKIKIKNVKEDIKKLQDELKQPLDEKTYDEKKKQLDQYKSDLKKLQSEGNKYAAQHAKNIEEELKYQDELAKIIRNAERARIDAEIESIENDGIREREKRKEQHKRSLEDIEEQKKELYRKIYSQRKSDYENKNKESQSHYVLTQLGEKGWKGVRDQIEPLMGELSVIDVGTLNAESLSGVYKLIERMNLSSLTKKEAEQVRETLRKTYADIAKSNEGNTRTVKNEMDKQSQAYRDFLKKYGSYQEQKLALAEEYAKKIRKAEESGDLAGSMTLSKEYVVKEQERADKEKAEKFSDIKESMDWEGLFNDLSRYSVKFLKDTREQLQERLKDPNIRPEDAAVIAGKIGDIDNIIIEKTENTFRWVLKSLEDQKRLSDEARRATKEYEDALKDLNNTLEESHENIQTIGDIIEEEYGEAKLDEVIPDLSRLKSSDAQHVFDKLGIAMDSTSSFAKRLRAAFDKLAASEQKVETKTKKKDAAEAKEKQAKDKENVPFKERVKAIFKDIGEHIGEYLGPAADIASKLGMEDISKGFDGVNSSVDAVKNFASGNYLGALSSGLDALESFGVLGGAEESDKTYAEDMQRLAKSNEKLREATERLADVMSTSDYGGIEDAYEKQKEYWSVELKNLKEQASRSLTSYMSSDWKGSGYEGSSGREILKYLEDKWIDKLDEILPKSKKIFEIAKSFTNVLGGQDLEKGAEFIAKYFSLLTPEQYALLRDQPELWARIVQLADQGHQGAGQYLEELADMADKLEDIEKSYQSNLSGITFDSLQNNFVSALMSMEDGAKSTAKDISKIMAESLVKDLVYGDKYKDKMTKWYESLTEALKAKDRKALVNLKKEYQDIMDDARKEADEIKEYTGYNKDYSQQAVTGSISNISYGQADSLVGIATSMQIAQEQGNVRLTMLTVKAEQIYSNSVITKDIAADSRDILAGMAIHVEEIRDGVVDTIVPRIKNIDDNLNKVYRIVEGQ